MFIDIDKLAREIVRVTVGTGDQPEIADVAKILLKANVESYQIRAESRTRADEERIRREAIEECKDLLSGWRQADGSIYAIDGDDLLSEVSALAEPKEGE